MNTGGNQNENNNEAPTERATELHDDHLPGTACNDEKWADENASKLPPKEIKQEDQAVNTTIIAKMKTEDGGSPKVVSDGCFL